MMLAMTYAEPCCWRLYHIIFHHYLGQLGFDKSQCLRPVLGYITSVSCGVIAIAAIRITSITV
jgi:hypothetical protein